MTTSAEDIVELVTKVLTTARNSGRRETVELADIHRMCLDEARNEAPHLVEFLASVRGLVTITITLSQLSHIVATNDPKGVVWSFVRPH